MTTIPFHTPWAEYGGLRFNFVDAFDDCAASGTFNIGHPADVYPPTHTLWGVANGAYDSVGLIGDLYPANATAFGRANEAYNEAGIAGGWAQTAQATADTALQTANTASSTASSAFTLAGDANGAAAAAQTTANEAITLANSANDYAHIPLTFGIFSLKTPAGNPPAPTCSHTSVVVMSKPRVLIPAANSGIAVFLYYITVLVPATVPPGVPAFLTLNVGNILIQRVEVEYPVYPYFNGQIYFSVETTSPEQPAGLISLGGQTASLQSVYNTTDYSGPQYAGIPKSETILQTVLPFPINPLQILKIGVCIVPTISADCHIRYALVGDADSYPEFSGNITLLR